MVFESGSKGFLVGELSDGEVASQIVTLLRQQGVAGAEKTYDSLQKRYGVIIEREEDLPRAFNIYRHGLGLPPVPESLPEAAPKVPMGVVTVSLVGISVALWLLMRFDLAPEWIELLYIAREDGFLLEVQRGQFWRLFSPMLLHFNFLHILFNMMCLLQFGSIQENLMGRSAFIGFVLVTALFSNVFQYIESGPLFGGMSGVLFAQIGFLWCYKKCVPDFPHGLPKDVVVAAGVWFVLCLTGIFFFKMANIAHGVGIAVGILLAILWSLRTVRRPPWPVPVGAAVGIVALTYLAQYWL